MCARSILQLVKREPFSLRKSLAHSERWDLQTVPKRLQIFVVFSTAGESLPLATSNQILIRFTSKGQSSSKGFHLAYQGECTVWVPVAAACSWRRGGWGGGCIDPKRNSRNHICCQEPQLRHVYWLDVFVCVIISLKEAKRKTNQVTIPTQNGDLEQIA